ncbi:MAG: response regulator transcription factor [Pseudomonadota bacterium]
MKVLIADDHPMVRDALARTVRELDAAADVQQAGDFDSLLRLALSASAAPVDLALVDLNMPGMNGVDGLRRLREQLPTLPVVIASGQDDAATVRNVLAAGAVGFIPKTERTEVLLNALRLILAGGVYVPLRSLEEPSAIAAPAQALASGLTPRQRDVLRALSRGQPNKLIARELGLTEGTVKIHIAAILRALQARNRTEAVVRAQALGLDERGGPA